MYIHPNMRLYKPESQDDGLLAFGDVRINSQIVVKGVKVLVFNQPNNQKRYSVLMPRREVKNADGSSQWKDAFELSESLKKEINEKVLGQVRELMLATLHKPEVVAQVTLCKKGDFIGFAKVTIDGMLTIKDIRVYRKPDGDGISLSYPATPKKDKRGNDGAGGNGENIKWDSLVDIDSWLVNHYITSAVEKACSDRQQDKPPLKRGETI